MTDQTPKPGPAPAESFGRVAEDGTVFLRLPTAPNGQLASSQPGRRRGTALLRDQIQRPEPLAGTHRDPFGRQQMLTARRRSSWQAGPVMPWRNRRSSAISLLLMARIGQLEVLANIRGQILDEERKAATIASQQAREKIVAEAEELAASTAWKQTGERYRALVDEWKNSQAHSGQRPATDALGSVSGRRDGPSTRRARCTATSRTVSAPQRWPRRTRWPSRPWHWQTPPIGRARRRHFATSWSGGRGRFRGQARR